MMMHRRQLLGRAGQISGRSLARERRANLSALGRRRF